MVPLPGDRREPHPQVGVDALDLRRVVPVDLVPADRALRPDGLHRGVEVDLQLTEADRGLANIGSLVGPNPFSFDPDQTLRVPVGHPFLPLYLRHVQFVGIAIPARLSLQALGFDTGGHDLGHEARQSDERVDDPGEIGDGLGE
ncbi:hypothetical protein [Dactylosporangium vinaceum]|uniref:Uncharacterized protein n=1 Tax=Dactylosporangium vinaceum TaxID=53362 RepID=A0ABV5M4Q9_9ACTN